MKKPVLALVAALVVVDAAALVFYLKYKKAEAARAAAAAAAPPPAPAPAPEPALPPPAPGHDGSIATPGGCKSIEECDVYCRDAAHQKECVDFLGPAGNKPPEAEQEHPAPPARVEPKQGEAGGAPIGPGGCTSASECQQYCADPGHSKECQSFGFSERKRIIARISEAPDEVSGCIEEAVGEKPYARFMAGKSDVSPRLAKAMQQCFQAAEGETGPKPTQSSGGNSPRPGGCSSPAACTQYCFQVAHAPECLKWKDLPPQFRTPLEQMVRDGH